MRFSEKFVRPVLFAFVLMAAASFFVIRAQEPPSPQQQTNPDQNPSIGRELAHETREAAGEEKDENDQFKKSSSVQIVARLTGLNLQYSYWLCMLLNFVIIAWVIVWAGHRYLSGAFRDRTAAIQKAMREAQKASEEARRKLAEIEARLQRLDVEIAMMRDAAEREAAVEEARIKAAAEEDGRKIVTAAEQEIAAATKAARRQLTAYAADLAVGLAQKQIRVDPQTDRALVRTFASDLSAATNNSGKDAH
jgi:F-type H+-transporting ATPase subunit b